MTAIKFGLPEGLVLSQLLFKNYWFFKKLVFVLSDTDIGNFADDNLLYISAKNVDHAIEFLMQVLLSLFKCSSKIF